MVIRTLYLPTKSSASWSQQSEIGATQLIFPASIPPTTISFVRQDGHPYLAAASQWTWDSTTQQVSLVLSEKETLYVGRLELTPHWTTNLPSAAQARSYHGSITPNPSQIDLPLTPDTVTALDNLDALLNIDVICGGDATNVESKTITEE